MLLCGFQYLYSIQVYIFLPIYSSIFIWYEKVGEKDGFTVITVGVGVAFDTSYAVMKLGFM